MAMCPASDRNETASKLAQSILKKNLHVKPGERVTIEAWPHTLPWAVALARESRRMKALPMILYEDEPSYWDSVERGETKLLGSPAPHEFAALAKTNVYIHMWGPGDRVALNALPARQQADLFRWNDPWYVAARKSGLRGLRLEIGRPYPSLAQAYQVDQESWTNEIVAGSLVDPAVLERRAAPIAKALAKGKRLTITHSNGTELTLGLRQRAPLVFSGRPRPGDPKRPFEMLSNLPSGSLRVALDETFADGTLLSNRTCYFDDGIANGAHFEFSGGRLRTAKFDSGGERFDKGFRAGGKGRDQPGMFSIGLNPELRNTPQVEDVEAGAIMVSVGSNRFAGGKNKSPFFGWAVLAGATVEIDGKSLELPT
jgi:leucyl aminopeptidase (aminopeptidase T)